MAASKPALSPFALLRMPAQFALDDEAVQDAWRAAIAQVHPDRFAGRPAAERRVAEMWAARINDARDTLLDPVRRAGALLSEHGVGLDTETDTRVDPGFLMLQMQLRERAEQSAGDAAALQALREDIEAERARRLSDLAELIDARRDWAAARRSARELLFIEKLRRDTFGN
ncbi:MAG: Fe-S protein assembly co-chaperone HscB [Duodenibacillus sp.]|nr:Fe-S protein assembly co-chaperone HscB [Duodenibacillus sp.]